jgi:site-specific recombinase XerD
VSKPPAVSQKISQLGDLFSTFQMDRLVNNVSPKTLELYENAWEFFGPDLDKIRFDLKGKKGDDLMKAERVVLDTLKLARAKAKLEERAITPISINIYGRVMNTFLRFLQSEGIFTNRFVLEPLQEETGDRREFFRDDEILKLQNYRPKSFNQIRAWTIAMCMLDTGVRVDEALSLVPDDVDMHSEVITILGKGNKRRVVPMSKMFRLLLFRYTQKTAPGFTYVFGTNKGTKTSQRNALRDIGVVERKAGIRKLSWHSFRHTFATGFLRRGGDIYKLQRILGHADLKTTSVYLHMVKEYFTTGHDQVSSLAPMPAQKGLSVVHRRKIG